MEIESTTNRFYSHILPLRHDWRRPESNYTFQQPRPYICITSSLAHPTRKLTINIKTCAIKQSQALGKYSRHSNSVFDVAIILLYERNDVDTGVETGDSIPYSVWTGGGSASSHRVQDAGCS